MAATLFLWTWNETQDNDDNSEKEWKFKLKYIVMLLCYFSGQKEEIAKSVVTYDISNRSPVGHEGYCCVTPSKNQLRRCWYWTPGVPEAALRKTNHGEHYQHVPSPAVNLHLKIQIRNMIFVDIVSLLLIQWVIQDFAREDANSEGESIIWHKIPMKMEESLVRGWDWWWGSTGHYLNSPKLDSVLATLFFFCDYRR